MTDDIYRLCSDLVDETVAAIPTLATYLGIPGYDHLWEDFSLEGMERLGDMFRDQRRRVLEVPESDDPWNALARQVALEEVDRSIADYDAEEYLLDLNSLASTLQDMRDIFEQMDYATEPGWRDVVSRLNGLPTAAAQYVSRLEHARHQGKVVAQRQVLEGVRQARNHAGERSSFLEMPGWYATCGVDDADLGEQIAAGVEAARRAFAKVAEYLESEYLPDTVDHDPVGRERYARSARRFLGADLDLEEAYQWGWSEVLRLRERMAQVAEEILPGGGLDATLKLLLTDPERAAPSQEAFRLMMLERLQTALSDLDGTHFEVPPEIREIEVKMTPPGGSLGAYYNGPSEDFNRPGTVWWSKGDQQQIPVFDEVSTAYHEGFPGHHLQTGLQMTAPEHFSRFQKLLVWYSGSGEGWALYAEDLMEELGYLEKPDYVMGKLASEMLRACRVVIDIGSHLEFTIPQGQPFHPGEPWSFDIGVEMLDDYAAQDHDISISEMNRYLGWPGQAISYKLGQRAISDMRSEEHRLAGSAFDLKDFHARLLEVGSIGLDLLRDHMRVGEG